jgi:dienelactone hydrolase
MSIQAQIIESTHANQSSRSHLYVHAKEKRPLILVFPDWSGCNHFAKDQAKRLYDLGYAAVAVDVYGDGQIGESKEEKSALMQPFASNRHFLRERIQSILHTLQQHPQVNANAVGAIGFCFGGLCALDLARYEPSIRGVVSFHGILHRPDEASRKISSKILVLHGYADPMVRPTDVESFAAEMDAAAADWQIHMFSQTVHAFANPEANDPGFGTVFHPRSAQRAWRLMELFWQEIFAH